VRPGKNLPGEQRIAGGCEGVRNWLSGNEADLRIAYEDEVKDFTTIGRTRHIDYWAGYALNPEDAANSGKGERD